MKKAFEPIIDSKRSILLLGTMPGEKSLEIQQYYGNRGNQFWKLLYGIFDEAFTDDYAERLKFLERHTIALWDVLAYCEREGSLDSKILNEQANDFGNFYSKYPEIKQVFFTSKNAEKYYLKYVGKKDGIIYDVLPSPSGANATMPFIKKLEIWREKILPAFR